MCELSHDSIAGFLLELRLSFALSPAASSTLLLFASGAHFNSFSAFPLNCRAHRMQDAATRQERKINLRDFN